MIKWNLGGNEKLDGGQGSPALDDFIHYDNRPLEGCVVIDVTANLPKECLGKVDEIRASHIIEHFQYSEGLLIVNYWSMFLKSGGLMRLYCPDATKIATYYLKNRLSTSEFDTYLLGRQTYSTNIHRALYSQARLNKLVTKSGLKIISQNPRPNAYQFDMGVQAVKK